jgi:hypothetical protein
LFATKSATGAALEIASPIGIPDEFTLVIAADDVRRRYIVVWRKTKTDWGGVLEAP